MVLPDGIFRALIESLPDAVIIADRSGSIALINAQAEALFGYEREELLHQAVEVLVPDELRPAHLSNRSHFASRPSTRPMGIGLELLGQRKDGSRFPVEISLSPLVRGEQLFVTAVVRDVSERNRLRSEVEMERERQRIAMDLHDGTIQSIYAIALGLELAVTDVMGDPVAAGKRIDGSIDQLNTVIGDIRSYIFDLRPVRSEGDLSQDLLSTIDEFRGSSGLNVSIEVSTELRRMREDRATAMLHIAREALSNARKHSGALQVVVALTDIDGAIHLEVRDDGDGFDAASPQAQNRRGLRNMRLRTQHLGGMFDLESAPGLGTTVRVRMPAGL